MKSTPSKTGAGSFALITLLALFLFGGGLFAEEASDFEKMLRQAIKNEEAKDLKKAEAEKSSTKSEPAKSTDTTQAPKVASTTSPNQKSDLGSDFKSVLKKPATPTAQKPSGGWTVIVPNENKAEVSADPFAAAVAQPVKVNTEASTKTNAEGSKQSDATAKEMPQPVASVWDAMPVTVPSGFAQPMETQSTEKKNEKIVSKSDLESEKPSSEQASPKVAQSTSSASPWNVADTNTTSNNATGADSSGWGAITVVEQGEPTVKEAAKENDKENSVTVTETAIVADPKSVEAKVEENVEKIGSLWDAEPTTVEPLKEKASEEAPEEEKMPIENASVAEGAEEETDEKKSDEKESVMVSEEESTEKSEPEKVEKTVTEGDDSKDDSKEDGSEKADEAMAETEKSEGAEKESEKKAEETVSETKKEDAQKDSDKKPADENEKDDEVDEMSSVLDNLQKEKVSDKEVDKEKKTDKQETKKEEVSKDTSKDEVTEPEKLTGSRPSAKKEDAKKTDEKAHDKTGEDSEKPKKQESVKIVQKKTIALPKPSINDFDSDDEEQAKGKRITGTLAGDPHAQSKLKLMHDEIVNGMRTRNVTRLYDMWKSYARSTLRGTAGLNTGSEIDGRCRLSWYQQLYNDPIFSVFASEEFSRQLFHGLSGDHRYLAETFEMIRKKMDVPARNDDGIRFLQCSNAFEALNEVKRCVLEAQMAHAKALSNLSSAEKSELAVNIVPTFVGPQCVTGHTIPNRSIGRRLVNIMEKIDKSSMYAAAEALLPMTNLSLLQLLDDLPEDAFPKVMIGGQYVQKLSTSAGDIIIGGRENNVYDLDSPAMQDVVCVIDLGGDNVYREGTCNLNRPVLVVISLHGNDSYIGSKPGIQGGSILGVSMLIDVEGNDTYTASDIAQGSSIGGVGMLFDFAGDDNYKSLRRAQGHALCGVGILVDRAGNDKYRAALWAQGFGAPGGFGVLNDINGNDHYYCGGLYIDSYPEHPGYDGWGQGIGAGIRQVANGGIGVILDGTGNDVYEVDYFGHGGGYWLGVGMARDFDGNDIRHGSTLLAYNGGPRRESRWTRFANGFGCHYAVGYLYDDAGDDVYGGNIMGTGMAWDLAFGCLCDFSGNGRYTATGGMTQGVGAEGSIGVLFSYGGDDVYASRSQGSASSKLTYHSPSNCGSNFSFLIDYGGKDQYGCRAANNSYVQRGTSGGFLIDRPTDREAENELVELRKQIEQREKEIAEFNAAQEKAKEDAASKGRRYVPPRRRPMPISVDQQNRIGSVPSFDTSARTGANDVIVK